MKHYVYKITDSTTRQFYFGSRSHENPEKDDYMGSMETWTPENKDRLIKKIIKDDFETREDAIEYESHLIEKYVDDDLNENYHIPNKGFHTLGRKLSEEQKMKISECRIKYYENNDPWNKGKYHSTEAIKKMKDRANNRWTLDWFIEKYGEMEGKKRYIEKNKIHSENMSGENNPRYGIRGKNNPLYGKERSEETKRKISKTKSNNILQFSKDGIFIRKWGSVREAADHYGMHINSIYHNLKGRRPHANGYLWKYE